MAAKKVIQASADHLPSGAALRRDLETGEWERRYADVLALDSYDAGCRLVMAG